MHNWNDGEFKFYIVIYVFTNSLRNVGAVKVGVCRQVPWGYNIVYGQGMMMIEVEFSTIIPRIALYFSVLDLSVLGERVIRTSLTASFLSSNHKYNVDDHKRFCLISKTEKVDLFRKPLAKPFSFVI